MSKELRKSSDGAEDQLNKELVDQVVAGKENALSVLSGRVGPILQKRLLARGASRDEADEVVSGLWASVIPGMRTSGQSLLAAYNGRSSLTAWLGTIALNRWLDRKRRETVHQRWSHEERHTQNTFPCGNRPASDPALLGLLKDSLEKAFRQCDAESLVLLRLVFLHGLSQRDLAAAWGMREDALSRRLTRTMEKVSAATLEHIRQTDPWLELKWEDFLELCETFSDTADAKSPGATV